ncbi:MAG: PadR family transcriptional regulator [Rhodospirillaceae bacterium]|nr:PadR family transcriptional regulator [Rhodospirillaceae bacterium]
MKRINKTRYALLGMLSHQPMSGYDIKKALHMSTQYFWQESDGQIYPILAELLKEKCITSLAIESQGSRTRKVYQISSKGLEELKDWLVQEVVPTIPRNELLLKLFFGSDGALRDNSETYFRTPTAIKKTLGNIQKD